MVTIFYEELRRHWPRLAQSVEKGEPVRIVRDGAIVAELRAVGRDSSESERYDDVSSTIRELRRGQRLDGITIAELVEEGRD